MRRAFYTRARGRDVETRVPPESLWKLLFADESSSRGSKAENVVVVGKYFSKSPYIFDVNSRSRSEGSRESNVSEQLGRPHKHLYYSVCLYIAVLVHLVRRVSEQSRGISRDCKLKIVRGRTKSYEVVYRFAYYPIVSCFATYHRGARSLRKIFRARYKPIRARWSAQYRGFRIRGLYCVALWSGAVSKKCPIYRRFRNGAMVNRRHLVRPERPVSTVCFIRLIHPRNAIAAANEEHGRAYAVASSRRRRESFSCAVRHGEKDGIFLRLSASARIAREPWDVTRRENIPRRLA